MLETHTTRDGNTLLIAQMTDDHLRAFIRLILKEVGGIKERVNGAAIDPYQAALYGLKVVKPKDAAEINRAAIKKLYPYLTEAYLRNLDDIRAELVEVIGRSEPLPGGLPALPARTIQSISRVAYTDEDDIPF